MDHLNILLVEFSQERRSMQQGKAALQQRIPCQTIMGMAIQPGADRQGIRITIPFFLITVSAQAVDTLKPAGIMDGKGDLSRAAPAIDRIDLQHIHWSIILCLSTLAARLVQAKAAFIRL